MTLTPDRFERVKEIVLSVVDLPEAERRTILDQICGDDAELRTEVEELLHHDRHPASSSSPNTHSPLSHSLLSRSTPSDDDATVTVCPPSDRFTPGQILGHRYRIVRLLGRGGMGEVWQAYDLKLQVDVALKSIRPERFSGEQGLELLRREVRSAREVMSPNVCRIFDLVEEEGQEFVSMEYIDGETLLDILLERGPLDLREAMGIASQFLSGLDAIHQVGLVHRDVKPENIMVTRTGRVVLMDFGIAKGIAEDRQGTIAGTPAYMAPEQQRGESLDARADIFAAGVVLAEMGAPAGIRERTSRESIWRAVRQTPVKLCESPWRGVLERAVASEPSGRYESARDLARALEEVTLRVEGAEDKRPYPGLESFTEADAEFFFGREAEVEAVWKKLARSNLLAIIGPSGAGKTSFVQAGLLPAKPAAWRHLLFRPGSSPFGSMARALVPQLAGGGQAVDQVLDQLLRMEDPSQALKTVGGWRRSCAEALIVVDQFEELFTLCVPEVQASFAEAIGRLAIEADVRVLLVMRDDFLFHCHNHPRLAPIFSELTPLGPPSGGALRRALIQPALLCGYRFEDETLADEMLESIEGERGALPTLAFTVARLWERRDRERGLLTREAYERIGGVSGALAQHAEATLERIGDRRRPMVREIFRILVTAQGTRAVTSVDDLLSVFEDREPAAQVLQELVNARLLTLFERPDIDESAQKERRIEIVHESLLGSWPRLVRWQTQDADGAQLRDQLRQAAQGWKEHGEPEGLLWTGAVYQDFRVWRRQYSGRLTEVEERFAAAMTHRAERGRRRREAKQLLQVGRNDLDMNPSAALAYAIASLELADSQAGRRFALEALARGPVGLFPPTPFGTSTTAWSSDSRWLAVGGSGGVVLFERETGRHLQFSLGREEIVGITSDGRLVTFDYRSLSRTVLLVRMLPDGRIEHTLERPVTARPFLCGDRLLTFECPGIGEGSYLLHWLSLDGATDELVGRWESPGVVPPDPLGDKLWLDVGFAVDPGATWVASIQEGRVVQQRLDALAAPPRVLGTHEGSTRVHARPWRDRVVTSDDGGEVRVWDAASGRLERTLKSPADARRVALDPKDRFLATGPAPAGLCGRAMFLFDLAAPRTSEPLSLLAGELSMLTDLNFSPDGSWLITMHDGQGVLWNMTDLHSRVVGRQRPPSVQVVFAPDGRLVSTSDEGVIRLWSLDPAAAGEGMQVLWSRPEARLRGVEIDPEGRFVVTSDASAGKILIVPLNGSPLSAYEPKGPPGRMISTRDALLHPSGRLLAVFVHVSGSPEANSLRIVDWATGAERTLDTHPVDEDRCFPQGDDHEGWVSHLWLSDGQLITDGDGGLRLWDLAAGTSHRLRPCRKMTYLPLLASRDSRTLVRLDQARRVDGTSTLSVLDLDSGATRTITSHGNRLSAFTLDATGRILVTAGRDGVVRVGPISGEEPRVLIGHRGTVSSVAVSPDGRWIASGSNDGTIRLWAMPDFSKPPLHTLPHDELLTKLRLLTNLRAVRDKSSDSGWKIEIGPFPGWAKVPELSP